MAVTVTLVFKLGISTVHFPAYRFPLVGLVWKSVASFASGVRDTTLCDPSRCSTVAQWCSPCSLNRVACYRNTLDVVRWWPWYALRPIAGFIFGVIAILLVQVGLFQPGSASASRLTWGLIVGILSGFGASEFADRLRLLTKTVFGEAPGEKPPPPATL